MKEVRLSIPIIGGLTVIYTREEIASKTSAAKSSVRRGMAAMVRVSSNLINKLADKISADPLPAAYTPEALGQSWGKSKTVTSSAVTVPTDEESDMERSRR